MRLPRSLFVCVLACACEKAPSDSALPSTCTVDQPSPYADGTYVGLHGNPSNNNFIPCPGPSAVEPVGGLLGGYLVFQPVTLSADGTTLYATAARTEGCSLFAVDVSSQDLRWCADGLTLGVSAATPEVDMDGNLYVTDGWIDESWMISYTPEGQERWRTSLEGLGGSGPATYRAATGLHLSPDGWAVMVTVDGVVVLADRATGALRATFDIPAATGFVPVAARALEGEIPAYLAQNLEAVVGPVTEEQLTYVIGGSSGVGGVFASNTVAIAPSGQVLVVGGGPDPQTGALVALDVTGGEAPTLSLRWTLSLTGGSGTSPAISPDGRIAAIGDGAGNLVRVPVEECNANTDKDPEPGVCAAAWTWPLLGGDALLASPGVDDAGVLYAWYTSTEPQDPDLVAVQDVGGAPQVVWEAIFAGAGDTNRQWTSSATVMEDLVLGTLTDMQQVVDLGVGFPILLQASHEVVAVSRSTGEVAWRQPVDDDSINSIAPGPDGEIYVPLMGMLDLASPSPDVDFTGGVAVFHPEAP